MDFCAHDSSIANLRDTVSGKSAAASMMALTCAACTLCPNGGNRVRGNVATEAVMVLYP